MTGRRHPRKSRSGRTTFVVLLAAGVVVMSLSGFATSSFSMQTTDRSMSADVVDDQVGVLGLDTAASVTIGTTDRLVDVTNRIETGATVTIELHADSTEKGELVVNGEPHGNQTSFSLSQGATQQVDIAVADGQEHVGTDIHFDVTASAPGVVVESPDRNTTIEE